LKNNIIENNIKLLQNKNNIFIKKLILNKINIKIKYILYATQLSISIYNPFGKQYH